MYFYSISVESVRIAAQFIKLRKCFDKEVIFRQFDQPNMFYCVLKGSVNIKKNVSIRIPKAAKTSISSMTCFNFRTIIEEPQNTFPLGDTILLLNSGHCFGHWGLLEKKLRTASAVSQGDTWLLEMSRFGFEQSFKKDMHLSESLKKIFVASVLPTKDLSKTRVDSIYKSCIPIVFL